MRIASVQGRAVLVSPDGQSSLDIAKASGGGFGPEAGQVYDEWERFTAWAAAADLDFAAGEPFSPARAEAPSPAPRQVFAIGLNYRDHADESGQDHPTSPPTFTKFVSSFAGPEGTLLLPKGAVDWEAELVAVIGREARNVTAADAWGYVAGLTAGQDYSERVLQLTGPSPQFSLGKSYPGFAPQGPWLVTPDEFDNPDDLAITCAIDGEVMQDSRTSEMIFSVPALVERLSAVLPLYPGDVIFTGTPAGIGGARKPMRFLKAGEVVTTTIEGIGSLRQTCADAG